MRRRSLSSWIAVVVSSSFREKLLFIVLMSIDSVLFMKRKEPRLGRGISRKEMVRLYNQFRKKKRQVRVYVVLAGPIIDDSLRTWVTEFRAHTTVLQYYLAWTHLQNAVTMIFFE